MALYRRDQIIPHPNNFGHRHHKLILKSQVVKAQKECSYARIVR